MARTHFFRSVDWSQGAEVQPRSWSANRMLATHLAVHRDGTRVLTVSGEVDRSSEDHFRSALRECLALAAPVILVDLFEVTYFSLTAARIVSDAHRLAEERGTAMRVVNAAPAAARLLAVSDLDAEAVPLQVGKNRPLWNSRD